MAFITLVLFIGLCFYLGLYTLRVRTQARRLPPGPPPSPLLGNIRDLPPAGVPEYQHWLKHRTVFGHVSSIRVFGHTLIIVHDRKAVHYLLETNADQTSSRPQSVFGAKLCGYDRIWAMRPSDDVWRQSRKSLQQFMGPRAFRSLVYPHMEWAVSHLLRDIYMNPEHALEQVQRYPAAIILRATYGYEIDRGRTDLLAEVIDIVFEQLAEVNTPGRFLVDLIPVLQFLPEFLPGMDFKNELRQHRRLIQCVLNVPYAFSLKRMKTTQQSCYVSNTVLENSKISYSSGTESGLEEEFIKRAATTACVGSSHTSVAVLRAFVHTMAENPVIQEKVQKEIDDAMKSDQLPSLADREALPYLNAVLQELHRWTAVSPMSGPRSVSGDISLGNFIIPDGAVILASNWWYLNDPAVYPDPSSFNPDRFLEPQNEPDPKMYAFGLGQRTCPGRAVADAQLFLAMAQILATFTISNGADDEGVEVHATRTHTPGLFDRYLLRDSKFEFKVKSTPRMRAILAKSKEMDGGDSLAPDSNDLEWPDDFSSLVAYFS